MRHRHSHPMLRTLVPERYVLSLLLAGEPTSDRTPRSPMVFTVPCYKRSEHALGSAVLSRAAHAPTRSARFTKVGPLYTEQRLVHSSRLKPLRFRWLGLTVRPVLQVRRPRPGAGQRLHRVPPHRRRQDPDQPHRAAEGDHPRQRRRRDVRPPARPLSPPRAHPPRGAAATR